MVQWTTYTAFINLHGMDKECVRIREKITKKTAELDNSMTDLANQANRTEIAIDGVPEMNVFLKLVDFSGTLYVHPLLDIEEYLSSHPILHQDMHLALEAGMEGYIALDHNVFVRDFVPCALALLMNGEPKQVEKFFIDTLQLQKKKLDQFQQGEVVMPDFGEIGKVAPVDSGFWWIILLRAYTKSTGDTSLADKPECQKFIGLILSLFPLNKFDTFPTLLSADGHSINDHRMMGVSPIEMQALFFMALRCAMLLLKHDGPGKELIEQMQKHLHALRYRMRNYFWLDLKQLNDMYKTEEYSQTAVNKFNVMPDSLPDWVKKFMTPCGGYFIGNIGPSHTDFRWFCLGNCMAILSSLATHEQSSAIMDLIESRWEELVGDMPLKVCYPAIESHEWRIATGYDTKNMRWSYDNGPVLLWLLTAACIKTGCPQIARRAIELAETKLAEGGCLKFYDKSGRYVGKKPRKHKMWSVAGFMVSRMLLEDPSHLGMVAIEED